MRRIGLVAVALVLGLTACAHHMTASRTPDWKNPNVEVREGKYIVVDQEPIVVPKNEKDVKITWSLARGAGYTFAPDGIAIKDGAAEFKCNLEQGGERFACWNRHGGPGRFKYTIVVLDPRGGRLASDPFIVND